MIRPYQSRAIESLRAVRRTGARRMLCVAPTGSGKTFIACEVIESALKHGQRILVIAHRKELLDQFFSALYYRGITAGMMRAKDERTDPSCPVQLASIATLVRRDLPPADLVFVDEAHRAPSDSYARVLEQYPKATVIGLTATPARLDGAPLREHFDAMVEVASYSELIAEGFIRAPIVYAPKHAPDLTRVRRLGGDFHEGDLEKAMNRPHVVGDIVKEWQEKAGGRSTVVFAVGVEHSMSIAAQFRQAGVSVAHLDGTTSEDDRTLALMAVETGKVQVVTNCAVLCEGWDQPRVKACVMARPTLSLTLYMQCVGRILRPWGDLPPVVLDHAGNTERHGLPHEDRVWSLDGRPKSAAPTGHHICQGCYAYVDASPCPLCGYEAPSRPRELRTAPGSLEVVGGGSGASQDPRRAFFDRQLDRARHEGFKPGFASAKYKEKFGEWPPWDWGQEAKRAFENDPEWQEDQRKREVQRAFWQAKHARSTAPEMTFEGLAEVEESDA